MILMGQYYGGDVQKIYFLTVVAEGDCHVRSLCISAIRQVVSSVNKLLVMRRWLAKEVM